MSQYKAALYPSADNTGWDTTDPELAPFLPTTDQSGDWKSPTHAGVGREVGSMAALPPSIESMPLHAKAGTIGHDAKTGSPICSVCASSFPTNHQLERHATRTKHKAYLCTCRKGFTKSSALRRHIQESTQTREHKCPLCDHKCKRPGHVEQHLRLIHKKPNDVIKDLLSTQRPEPRQGPEQSSSASAAVPVTGSTALQADQPVVIPGGARTGPTGFSTTTPVEDPCSRPGYHSAFFLVLPSPGPGQVAQFPAFGSQSLMMQAVGLPAFPAFPAATAAAQTGSFANPAPDVSGYPDGPLDENLDFFNVNPASVSVNPAEGFETPALETGSMEGFYDFDLNTFGI